MTDPKPQTPPFDQRLANEAAAAQACMQLGAVVLTLRPALGFGGARTEGGGSEVRSVPTP